MKELVEIIVNGELVFSSRLEKELINSLLDNAEVIKKIGDEENV